MSGGAFENIPVVNLVFDQVESESGVCEVRYAPVSSLIGTPELTPIAFTVTVKELGIFLVKTRGGDQIQVGDICNPAYATTSSFTAGKTQKDTTGGSFTVEANGKIGIYTGTISEV